MYMALKLGLGDMVYCAYYRGKIKKELCWQFVAILRSFEHLAFDRSFIVEGSIFEFFVPKELQTDFEYLMKYFEEVGLLSELEKLPNRLEEEAKLLV